MTQENSLALSRRQTLIAGAAFAFAGAAPTFAAEIPSSNQINGTRSMTEEFIKTQDGVEIYYKDWGPKDAQPIVFHHGWPLSADDWDAQMMFFVSEGFRVIAHDRRGHGRSSQVSDGHDMDHYAADASAVYRTSTSKIPFMLDIRPAAVRSPAMWPDMVSRRTVSPRPCWSALFRH